MKKAAIVIVVILILGAAGYIIYSRFLLKPSAEVQTQFETAVLEKGQLVSTISAIGKVRPAQSATLNWQTSGAVEQVNVKVGETVTAGAVLARLAQTSLPQNVILAQADIASAQQALDDLTTNAETAKVKAMQEIVTYEQAVRDAQYQLDNFTIPTNQADMSAVEAVQVMKEALDKARQAFEPYKFYPVDDSIRQTLLETLGTAQSDYNAAVKRLKYEYDLAVAQANLTKAQQDYARWKDGPNTTDVEAAKARIAAEQATLALSWIEAPFAGTVTQSKPLMGDRVTSSTLAFRLDDLTAQFVDLEVSEIDINQVDIGQEATVTCDAIRGQQYHGQVTEVAMVSSQSSDVVNYTVTVKLIDTDQKVRAGMTCEVEIVVAQREEALLVPNQAVRLVNGKQVVYIVKPGQGMTPVEVTLGLASDTYSELLEGNLQPGDQVVLNPTDTGQGQQGMRGFFMGRPSGEGDNVQPAPAGGQP